MGHSHKLPEPKIDLAKIVKIEDNNIFVKVVAEGCKNCALSGICKLEDNIKKFKVSNISQFKIGDFVNIIVKSGSRIFSAFMIFIFPLFFMFGFYFLSTEILHLGENLSALISIIGLIVGGIVLKLSDKKLGSKISYEIKKWSPDNENSS